MAIKVKARRPGVYQHYREADEVFHINHEKELGSWMEVLDKPAGRKQTGKPDKDDLV